MHHLRELPPSIPPEELETRAVLRKLRRASTALGELKGVVSRIPNERILIDTLSLQEAKDSSAVENIVTTHDELYKIDSEKGSFPTPAAKEVHNHARALNLGYEELQQRGIITINMMVRIQEAIVENDAGIRRTPGTTLKNERTGELIYEPPQDPDRIRALLRNLEELINGETGYDVDPLVKMALIHHQFESIHPFYDGNGRAGRILNLLYLIKEGFLDLPVLYISRYIIKNRPEYYRRLQEVRDTGNWENWILFMLDAVEVTAKETVALITAMGELMKKLKHKVRQEEPKIYSQDLVNNLFRHPYTKIAFLEEDLGVSRLTARKYLEKLKERGILEKVKAGRTNYYVNRELFELLQQGSGE